MTPKGIALDLRKPALKLYWTDEGNKTRGSVPTVNATVDMLDGRVFRSNLDGRWVGSRGSSSKASFLGVVETSSVHSVVV